jgi:DNA polymerase II small subunit/DNA polymerase delta subunit B
MNLKSDRNPKIKLELEFDEEIKEEPEVNEDHSKRGDAQDLIENQTKRITNKRRTIKKRLLRPQHAASNNRVAFVD